MHRCTYRQVIFFVTVTRIEGNQHLEVCDVIFESAPPNAGLSVCIHHLFQFSNYIIFSFSLWCRFTSRALVKEASLPRQSSHTWRSSYICAVTHTHTLKISLCACTSSRSSQLAAKVEFETAALQQFVTSLCVSFCSQKRLNLASVVVVFVFFLTQTEQS